ncbi:MAG: hypothetical protein ACOCXX_01245 [Planctomycetota bacterium]
MMTMFVLVGVAALSVGCSKSESEKVIDAMEEVVEKMEAMAESDTITQEDGLKLLEMQVELAKKAQAADEAQFTEAEKKELQDLMERGNKAMLKIQQKQGG